MSNFVIFAAKHWILLGLFIIAFIWLIIEEARHQGLGGARQTPQGVTDLINRQAGVVIDLRDANAFADGHITNSLNIPLARLAQSVNKIEKYKDQPIILVCAMGQHSVKAMHQCKKWGFNQVYLLGGGLSAWKRAGLPLVKN